MMAYLKRGLIKINSKLYKGSFFSGKLFFKTQIDISEKSKVSILKFRKSQKLAWFSIAKPDLATEFDSFEVNILNDNHTNRLPILDLKGENKIEPVIEFLNSKFGLKIEEYSPNF